MSEEIYGAVQVIELLGRGAGSFWRGIRLSAQTAEKGIDFIKLKEMQMKMKLHYASTGTHDTMKLSDLEKLTGGQYDILNIPFENERDLMGFYDRLKKLKVSFAELPDMELGDGFTQIAFNPQDASLVKTVTNYYKDKLEEEAAVISLEQYEKLGGENGQKLLDELAEKGYNQEKHMAHLQQIRDRNINAEYIPISLNIDSLLLREESSQYLCRIPGSVNADRTALAFYIRKEEALILDKGQTIYSHLKKGDEIKIVKLDSHWNPTGEVAEESAEELAKYFSKVREGIRQSDRVRVDQTECMPNFNYGQNPVEKNLESVHNEGEDRSSDTMQPQEAVTQIVKKETMKEKSTNPEYIPSSINLREQLIAEGPSSYMLEVPQSVNKEKGSISFFVINKKDATVSKDGSVLFTQLKKDGITQIYEHLSSGKEVGKRNMKNEDLIRKCSEMRQKSSVGVKTLAEHKEHNLIQSAGRSIGR